MSASVLLCGREGWVRREEVVSYIHASRMKFWRVVKGLDKIKNSDLRNGRISFPTNTRFNEIREKWVSISTKSNVTYLQKYSV
jgi:hypothetical protein